MADSHFSISFLITAVSLGTSSDLSWTALAPWCKNPDDPDGTCSDSSLLLLLPPLKEKLVCFEVFEVFKGLELSDDEVFEAAPEDDVVFEAAPEDDVEGLHFKEALVEMGFIFLVTAHFFLSGADEDFEEVDVLKGADDPEGVEEEDDDDLEGVEEEDDDDLEGVEEEEDDLEAVEEEEDDNLEAVELEEDADDLEGFEEDDGLEDNFDNFDFWTGEAFDATIFLAEMGGFLATGTC